MKIVDLVLLRHGAPVLRGTLLGRLDSAPTPQGTAACVDAVARLALGCPLGHVVSSPLRRAAAAAEVIASSAGLDVRFDARWQELDFGAWDGRTVDALTPDHAPALERFWQDPDLHPPPGGERWSAICARVAAALTDIIAMVPEALVPAEESGASVAPVPAVAPILVVAHGGSIRAAVSTLCDYDFAQTMRIDLPYAAVLRLRIFADGVAPPSAVIRSLG